MKGHHSRMHDFNLELIWRLKTTVFYGYVKVSKQDTICENTKIVYALLLPVSQYLTSYNLSNCLK